MRRISLSLLFFSPLLLLNGCSGGGGGGAAPPVSGSTPPATYLFYSASLHAVDPATPTSPVLVDAFAAQPQQVFHGFYDGGTYTVSGTHARSTVYASGGRIWKVSNLISSGIPGSLGNPPVQLSNEATIGTTPTTALCKSWVEGDLSNINNALYVYKLAGSDFTCNSNDDVVKMVSLGMDITTSPVTLPAGVEPMVSIVDLNTGALTSALFLNRATGELVRKNIDFSGTPVPIRSGVTNQVRELLLTNDNRLFLQIDGDVYLYNLADNALSASLFDSGSASAEVAGDNDASAYYFWVKNTGNAIYKFPFSGRINTDLVTLATEPTGTVISGNASLTNNRVVYATYTAASNEYALKSVLKTGGVAPTPLIAATTTYTGLWVTAGNRIYFNQGLSGAPSAGVINEDGTSLVPLANARWVGAGGSTTATLGEGHRITKVMLAGFNIASSDFSGGALTAYDAVSFSSPINLGTIPAGVTEIVLIGFDMPLLGTIKTPSGSGTQDVFLANMSTAGSLARVTNTNSVNEVPLF